MAVDNSSHLSICHLNAQSIDLHFADICYQIKDNCFQIIALTETGLKPNRASKFFEIPEYTLLRVDRLDVRSGGVTLYVDASIS